MLYKKDAGLPFKNSVLKKPNALDIIFYVSCSAALRLLAQNEQMVIPNYATLCHTHKILFDSANIVKETSAQVTRLLYENKKDATKIAKAIAFQDESSDYYQTYKEAFYYPIAIWEAMATDDRFGQEDQEKAYKNLERVHKDFPPGMLPNNPKLIEKLIEAIENFDKSWKVVFEDKSVMTFSKNDIA